MSSPLTLIKHRVNTIKDLNDVDITWGVEIDLRSDVNLPGHLHLSHDPWTKGEAFRDWLVTFKKKGIKGPLILNTKEDGLEDQVVTELETQKISNYFFLDTAFPTLVKWVMGKKSPNFFLRLSAFESRATVELFRGKIEWLWVDCFDGIPPDDELLKGIKPFKCCLVSPELQGKSIDEISRFSYLRPQIAAVCTKRPDLW